MVHIDTNQVRAKFDELGSADFITFVTDAYLDAVGGQLTADNMELLSVEQHALLCYRYMLDEVMEGGFIQLIVNGYGPYVLEGPFPYVVKKEWGMKDFSKLLFEAKKQYNLHKEDLLRDMSEEDFMAMYEELDDLNMLGDDFLDDHQEQVSPAVAKMVMKNIEKYV
ncbi:MAG: DMP19 family protein [Bacteroidales bacterium]|nr:DMP19 family protein [Bacteroidales bacterium]